MFRISAVALTLGCSLIPVACLPAQAVGQSAQSAPATQSQKSTAGAATTATFVNNGSQNVDLYWIGYDGKEQKMASIAAGKRIAADSAIGHIWKLKLGQRDVATFNVANANPEFEFKGMTAASAPSVRSAPPTIRSTAPSPPRAAAPPPRPPSASPPPRPAAATGAPPRPAAPSTPSNAARAPAPPRIAAPNPPARPSATNATIGASPVAQQLPTVWRGEEELEFKRLSDGGWILAGADGEVLENLKEVTRRNRFARLALSDLHSFLIVDDAVFESEHPEDCYFMMAGQWQGAQRANAKRKLTHWKGTRDKSVLEWRRESDGKWSFLADGHVESQWEEDFNGSEEGQALVVLLQPADGIVAEVYDGVALEHLEDEDSFAIVSYGFFQDGGPKATRASGMAAPQAPPAGNAPRPPARPNAPPPPPKRN